MRRLPGTMSIVFVLAAAAGCSGAKSAGGKVPPSEYRTRLLEATCEGWTRCGLFPDIATCKESDPVAFGNDDQQLAGVEAGRIRYDSNAAAACLAGISAMGCDLTGESVVAPLACLDIFKGSVPNGGACYLWSDCASSYCDRSNCPWDERCCIGTCVAVEPIPVGGDCNGVPELCIEGTYCKQYVLPYTCTVEASLGQDCDPNGVRGLCEESAFCVPSTGSMGGACAPPPAEGEPCSEPSYPRACNSNLDYCTVNGAGVIGICARKLGPDEPCSSSSQCVDYTSCRYKKCMRRQKLGGACDVTSSEATCMFGLKCDAGTCVLEERWPVCR